MNQTKLNVSMGPHVHDGSHASAIMTGFLIAMLPAACWGIYMYGVAGLRTLTFAMGSAVLWEWLARMIMKRSDTLYDKTALVEGMLLGLLCPANTPWWVVITASFFMIMIAKQIFGGYGYYPFHPVLIGFSIAGVSWPAHILSHYTLVNIPLKASPLEPLWALRSYGPEAVSAFNKLDLFLGYQVGGLGVGSILLITIGGLYLMIRGFIPWRVTLSYLAGILVFQSILFYANPERFADPIFHLLTGRTVFCSFFLITNFVVCPVNSWARVIYGAGAAVMTLLIRNFGAYPDGSVLAILVLNMFHPIIDRIRKPVLGLNPKALQLSEE